MREFIVILFGAIAGGEVWLATRRRRIEAERRRLEQERRIVEPDTAKSG